tara:strand:+ start:5583 stop:5915 length:333 start_codon:yes stop_codon:yes gene_type:complete
MKKLLGIVVLGLLFSGNAFADKPVIICSFLSLEGKRLGEHIFDLNVSNIYKITEYDSTGISWYYFADTGEKVENSVNRLTGRIQYTVIEKNGSKFHYTGICYPHSFGQKF